jgi:D-sedoheptulose 7-phosphate isomerase
MPKDAILFDNPRGDVRSGCMTSRAFPRDALGGATSVERAFHAAAGPSAFAKSYLNYLRDVLEQIDVAAIDSVVEALLAARAEDRTIFVLGNGGSAATAAHLVNDLTGGMPASSRRFRIFSLVDNAALLSAVANDYGYENVFVRQLEGILRPGDVVIAISASGSSRNVVRAVTHANAVGAVTVGLTGFDGGRLRQLARIHVHVPTDDGEYGPAEDAHLALAHVITNYLRRTA